MSTLNLAIVAAVLSTDPRQAARSARQLNFRGISFDAISPTLDLTDLSQTGRREFSRMLASNDLALAALRADLTPKGLAPGADIDRALSRLTSILQVARDLNASVVCMDIGPLPEPAPDENPAPKITPEQAGLIIIPQPAPPPPKERRPVPGPNLNALSIVDRALKELGTITDRIGTTIALRSDLSSFSALHRAVAQADCPSFAIDLDPVAILGDDLSIDEIFSRFGNLIRHVRARDAVKGTDNRTRPAAIGQGSTNWNELLNAIDQTNFQGWITIDPLELPDRRNAATLGAAHLNGID